MGVMTRKIGLLLGGEPSQGGLYQYTLSMLDAVEALVGSSPRREGEYQVVFAYLQEHWGAELARRGLRSVSVKRPAALRAAGYAIRKSGLKEPLSLRSEAHTLRVLLRHNADLWLIPNVDLLTYDLRFEGYKRLPFVANIYDLMHRYEMGYSEVSDKAEYDLRERIFSGMCKTARAVTVDSEIGRQQACESYGIPLERVFKLPFIPPRYLFASQTPAGFETRYPLPAKFIFYPAQFWDHKNHPRLLRALARAQERAPDMALVLVGGTKHANYTKTRQLAQELGLSDRVIFAGYVPNEDIPEFYRRARAMIFASLFGPTNIPPLEALALGCPCACSNAYAMPEQVGDAALLFDPKDEAAMADALVRLWTDDALRAELTRRGKARAGAWTQVEFNARVREIVDLVVGSSVLRP